MLLRRAIFAILFGVIALIFPALIKAQTDDTVIILQSDTKLAMDFEGEAVKREPTYKQAWYWDMGHINGYNILVSRNHYVSRKRLMTKTESCTNDTFLTVKRMDMIYPWHLWTTGYGDGTIRSKCGPGWRLRRVGNYLKLIEDDVCKVAEEDKFIFEKMKRSSDSWA